MLVAGCGSWLAQALASCAGFACWQGCKHGTAQLAKFARAFYTALFLASLLLSLLLRDYARPLVRRVPWIAPGGDAWYGEQAVLRVSLGSALFFGGLSLLTRGVRSKADPRAALLHEGSWTLKTIVWLIFLALPFFLPTSIVGLYRWVARAGSGVFLVLETVILLDAAHAFNDRLASRLGDGPDGGDPAALRVLLIATAACVVAVLGGLAATTAVFVPRVECSLNAALVAVAAVGALAPIFLVFHPRLAGKASILPPAVGGVYTTYLAFSALASEPSDYPCNGLADHVRSATDSTLLIGVVVTMASVAYAALRAGSRGDALLGEDIGGREGDDVAWPSAPTAAPRGGGGGASDDVYDPEFARALLRRTERELARAEGREPDPSVGASLAAATCAPAQQSAAGRAGSPSAAADDAASLGVPLLGPRSADHDANSSDRVPYNISFFHLVFALASMYIAMLMTGWGAAAAAGGCPDADGGAGGGGPDSGDGCAGLIDVGWASVWAKMSTSVATSAMLAWSIVAPLVLPGRRWD